MRAAAVLPRTADMGVYGLKPKSNELIGKLCVPAYLTRFITSLPGVLRRGDVVSGRLWAYSVQAIRAGRVQVRVGDTYMYLICQLSQQQITMQS